MPAADDDITPPDPGDRERRAAEAESAATANHELRDAALAGVRWVAGARIASEIVAFAAAIALARLLAPAEFGRAAVALAIVPLAAILTFEGCASSLVQRPEIGREHRDSAAFLSISTGIVLTILTAAISPLLAPIFGDRIAALVLLVSPAFLLASPGCVPRALLWRELQFRRLSMIEVAGLLAGSGTSVGLALAGLKAEALIGGGLAMTGITSLLLCLSAPIGTPRLHSREAKDIAGFGIPAALAGLVHVGFANVDYVIMAARLSATQAGLYWRAFQLGVTYQEKVSGILLRLAYPVYSRAPAPEDVRRMHERATRLHATIVLPFLGFAAATAPTLVPWLFGPAWNGAVLPTQILAVAGMISAVLTGYPQVMLALNKPRELLRFNLAIFVLYGAVIVVAASGGLIAACIAAVGAHLLIFIGVYHFMLGRHLGVPMRRSLTDVAPGLCGTAIVAACGFPLRALLEANDVPSTAVLVVVGACSAIVYVSTIRIFFTTAWDDLMLLASRILPARLRPAAARLATPAAATTGGP